MSRYRAKRPFATSKLKAPFLRSIAQIPEKVAAGEFPFTLPFLMSGEFSPEFASPDRFLGAALRLIAEEQRGTEADADS